MINMKNNSYFKKVWKILATTENEKIRSPQQQHTKIKATIYKITYHLITVPKFPQCLG